MHKLQVPSAAFFVLVESVACLDQTEPLHSSSYVFYYPRGITDDKYIFQNKYLQTAYYGMCGHGLLLSVINSL